MAVLRTREEAQVERLILSFLRKRPDGTACYRVQDRKRLVQLLLVTLIPPSRYPSLPKKLQRMAGELSLAAKIGPKTTPADAMRQLQAFFAKDPPSPAILRDFNDALRTLGRQAEAAARKAAQKAEQPTDLARPMPPPMAAPIAGPTRAAALESLLPRGLEADRKAVLGQLANLRRFGR